MPSNLVKTPKQEKLWDRAKGQARKQKGRLEGDDWRLVNHIYQNMKKHASATAWYLGIRGEKRALDLSGKEYHTPAWTGAGLGGLGGLGLGALLGGKRGGLDAALALSGAGMLGGTLGGLGYEAARKPGLTERARTAVGLSPYGGTIRDKRFETALALSYY